VLAFATDSMVLFVCRYATDVDQLSISWDVRRTPPLLRIISAKPRSNNRATSLAILSDNAASYRYAGRRTLLLIRKHLHLTWWTVHYGW